MLNRLSSGRRCKDEVASDAEESGNQEADRVRISGHMHCEKKRVESYKNVWSRRYNQDNKNMNNTHIHFAKQEAVCLTFMYSLWRYRAFSVDIRLVSPSVQWKVEEA